MFIKPKINCAHYLVLIYEGQHEKSLDKIILVRFKNNTCHFCYQGSKLNDLYVLRYVIFKVGIIILLVLMKKLNFIEINISPRVTQLENEHFGLGLL